MLTLLKRKVVIDRENRFEFTEKQLKHFIYILLFTEKTRRYIVLDYGQTLYFTLH